MSTTAQRRAITRTIADLLRDRTDHDTPPAERTGWLVRKAELLATTTTTTADARTGA